VRRSAVIYEINAWVWLNALSRAHGRTVRLDNVPGEEWDQLGSWNFDAVWLMGVWERSPLGRQIASTLPELLTEYRKALPDFTLNDVVGSPYCIHRYVVDEYFGGPDALRIAREELARRGMRLILDFVPNHVARDHPWTTEHPEFFVREPDGRIAYGRDPYCAPWTDVAQINVFHAGVQTAAAATLMDIASQCDGVRCDMAMLVLNDVFQRTWGDGAGPRPAEEYWSVVIPAVREKHRDFTMIAEVYWDLESAMQQLGFDYCYDKRLLDRLEHDNAASIRAHLTAELNYQRGLIRMIENHDEKRAADAFGEAKERAAAILISTLPGARLYHDGQFEGRKVKLPVQLGRRPEEPVDGELIEFYHRLLAACSGDVFRDGDWQLLNASGWPDNTTFENLLVCCRRLGDSRAVIAVNYSDAPAQGRVRLPWSDLASREWRLSDRLTGDVFVRDGNEMIGDGVFVNIGPWQAHFLEF